MATLTGIDVLIRDGFKPIAGQRVGLITNHTGLTLEGRSTIDVLHEAPQVTLAALFGPEHGIRGNFDERIKDATDAATGLPVYSLYGESFAPTPEQVRGLDALVFDIQDVGARFYTYSSTLGYAAEAAARNKLHMVVLDRPNPINGVDVEGPVADKEHLSFIAWHPVPVRHGMTLGELARLYNVERKIGAGLIVVPCEGWRRAEWYDATGLTWTNPSPNMRSLTEATLYPGVCLLERTNVSLGRGTGTPFEVVGAPWMDGRKLAERLNGKGLPGVRFIPIRFMPNASVHKGQACGGVNILITCRDRFACLRTGFELAAAIRDLFPADWNIDAFNGLLVNEAVFRAFKAGASVEELERLWTPELASFRRIRRKYLLYA